jgi:competence protein ComEA
LVATALAIIAVVAGGTWLLRGSPSRAEDSLPFASHATTSSNATAAATFPIPSTTGAASIIVYVAGAVTVPGIYSLGSEARVNDALVAAGGAASDANLDVVNLAAPVHDGERVYVPVVGETVPPAIQLAPPDEATTPSEPVNINTATAAQLDVLPGVGPTTAAAIVAHRDQHGPFQTIDQLGDVRGIGPAKLDALRGLVTV